MTSEKNQEWINLKCTRVRHFHSLSEIRDAGSVNKAQHVEIFGGGITMKDKRGTKPKKAKQPITSQKCLYKNIRQWAYYPEFRIAPGAELEEIMERMQLQQQLTPKEDVSQLSEDIIQRMDEQRMETGKMSLAG